MYKKPPNSYGICRACGRPSRLLVHQGCGAMMEAKRKAARLPKLGKSPSALNKRYTPADEVRAVRFLRKFD